MPSITGIALLYFGFGLLVGCGASFGLFYLILSPFTRWLTLDVLGACVKEMRNDLENGLTFEESVIDFEVCEEELRDKWRKVPTFSNDWNSEK